MNVTNISSAGFGRQPTNAISGASVYVPTPASNLDPLIQQMRLSIKQNSQDFKALKSALKANDLTGAAQAFATLQQDIQTASQAAGGKSPFDPNSPIGKDFQAIGDALKSGDIAAAKQAFATFKQDIQRAGHAARAHHHHHADNDGDDGGQSSASTTTPAPTVGSALNATA